MRLTICMIASRAGVRLRKELMDGWMDGRVGGWVPEKMAVEMVIVS